MSIIVQEILVFIIIIAAVAWIVIKFLLRKNHVSSCNCDGCPLSDCSSRKNMQQECKKKDKKIAHYDK